MTTRFSLQVSGGVGTLTMQPDPERKPPTLDHTSLANFETALTEIEQAVQRGELRVLFVVSANERFFCAGANVETLATLDETTIAAWIAHGHRLFARLEDLPVPTVARVEGYALGGGLELALACDLIFAAEGAQFGQTEARLGFVAGWGGSWRLPRRIGLAHAKEMFFSARMLPSCEAVGLGLADFSGPPVALAERCRQFAKDVLAGSPESHRQHKRVLAATAGRTAAAEAEAAASIACLRAPETRQRVQAFLAARK